MSERFLYEVHPVRPFVSPDGKQIKRACSIQLTKEEVKEYLKKGTVYRKFSGSNTKMERVTLSNLDSLHVRVKGEDQSVVEPTPVVEPEEIPAVEEPEVVEEPAPVEETPVVEEPVKEEITVTEEVVPQEVVTEEAPTVEEAVEEEVSEEDPVETISVDDILKEGTVQTSNNNQYHGKNKKKHH